MDERVWEVLESRIDGLGKTARRERDSDRRKTADEVFDDRTLMLLYRLFTHHVIDTLDFPISTGKEANVFHATGKGGESAVKIYRVTTSTFHAYTRYIDGDPRFKGIFKDKRKLIETWAMKEYQNLMRMMECGVPVPAPVYQLGTVVIMSYVPREDGSGPAPLLRQTNCPLDIAYDTIMGWIETLWLNAGMVHGDLSEFNVLVSGEGLVCIDVAQSVIRSHPLAKELLIRDVRTVERYFRKRGLELGSPSRGERFLLAQVGDRALRPL